MWQVDVVSETRGFESLRAEWSDLVDRCAAATVFQTFEWNHAWWMHIGRVRIDRRLSIITVRDKSGLLVGLAPFVLSLWHGTPLKRLSFMGVGASDYNDVIVDTAFASSVCDAIYRFLSTSGSWHIADFTCLREGSQWRSSAPPADADILTADFEHEKCPFLPYPPTSDAVRWETITKGYGMKTWTQIARKERRLKGLFEVASGKVDAAGELDDALSTLFELHRRRWNKRWLPGVLSGKNVQDFHRAVSREFLDRGWLRLHYLMLDGEYQALLYCYAFRDRTCFYQGGFEPSLEKHSLGTILMASAIHYSVDEGRGEFDFLRGDEPYKARWTQGHMRMNASRLAARRSSGLLPLAVRVHEIEHKIEMRFKEYMHHAYSKEPKQKANSAEKEG